MREWIGLLLLSCAGSLMAQDPAFSAFPSGSASRYQFDLARNFYQTDTVARSDQEDLVRQLRALETTVRGARSAAPTLLKLLETQDSLARRLGKQYAYLTLRPQLDSRDSDAQRRIGQLASVAQPVFNSINAELAAMTEADFASLVRREPRLARYQYAATLARLDVAHRLKGAAEGALAAREGQETSWGPALFQRLFATMEFGKVHAPEGDLDFRRQGNQIRNHIDRTVRAQGFLQNNATLGKYRDTFALILSRTAAARTALARERKWPDYPTQAYASLSLTPADVRGILTAVMQHAKINKQYERARIAEIKRTFGYDTVHVWDLSVPEPNRPAPRFTIEQATEIILAATRPFGGAYRAEMAALLDPANGRLDLNPRAYRVERPGFSTGSVGYPSMFFQGRFEGYSDDLVILAHEAGHAVQNMLMDSAGVLPRYAFSPAFFTESFATMNELLVLEHLSRTSADSIQRRYFRRRLLENALDLFRNSHESLLELDIYDSAAAGRRLSADDIEALTQRTGAAFSVWFGPGSERELQWLQPIQFYTWPLYRVNYTLAKLLALRYLDQLHRDPAGFQARYVQLLRNGYDAPPDVLLRRFMNIDLRDSKSLVDGAIGVITDWTNAR